jgi:hypothetical protein
MANVVAVVLLLLGPVTSVLAWALWRKLRIARRDLVRFGAILSVEERVRWMEAEYARADAAAREGLRQQELAMSERARQMEAEYARIDAATREVLHRQQSLTAEVGSLEQRVDMNEVGLLAPRYDFGEAFEYKTRLDLLRDQQSATVKAGRAAVCSSEWTISGSRAEGKRVTDKILKLMLRAFNGECDALIAKVRYDNARLFEDRIRKSRESINKLGAGFTCSVTDEYLDLKLHELHLTHEYQEKLQAEREEQRALREQMREEERAQKEIERAQREAEQEEERFSRALDKARQEAEKAVGEKQQRLLEQVRELEQKVLDAEAKRQRAISMAQLTKSGHVYILSNVGSFGEHVFKIGMTRRIVPQDRVDELGDASVPFARESVTRPSGASAAQPDQPAQRVLSRHSRRNRKRRAAASW